MCTNSYSKLWCVVEKFFAIRKMRRVLERKDDISSKVVIEMLGENEKFQGIAHAEEKAILERDIACGVTMKEGIRKAQANGVLPLLEYLQLRLSFSHLRLLFGVLPIHAKLSLKNLV